MPRANSAKAKSLQATIAELEAREKRPPEVDEIRKELLTSSEYEKLLKETQPVTFVPIDSSVDRGQAEGGLSLSKTFPILQRRTLWIKPSRRKKFCSAIKSSSFGSAAKILLLYYYEELKLSEIAQIFGLTEGRISQILSHSILLFELIFKTLIRIIHLPCFLP